MKLLLCSGGMRLDGWVRLDGDFRTGADIVAMIPPLPSAVTVRAWSAVMWIHGPSSLYRWETEAVLRQCREVLIDGGKLITECPDAEKCMRDGDLHGLFGAQDADHPMLANRYGWSPETLSKAMIDAGFREVALQPAEYHVPARDFRLEATK